MSKVKQFHLREGTLVEGKSLGCLNVYLASDYEQLKADNEAYKKLHDWLKAENEVLTLRVMAGERQELDALKSAPVVMPERKELSIYADEEFHRWLEQLPDEAARLNRSKT